MLNMAKHQKKNFTTTELLVVMAIIAVLMAMGLGVYSFASTKMAETRTRGTLKKLEVALERYKEKYGYYIQQAVFGYLVLDYTTSTTDTTKTYYVKNNFCQFLDDYEQLKKNDCELDTTVTPNQYKVIDGFGGKILYRCPGYFNNDKYDIVSAGSNGKIGNTSSTTLIPANTENSDLTTPSADAAKYLGKGDDIANFTR